MLYPKERKDERKLYYGCRNCDYEEEASDLNKCVYKQIFTRSALDQTTALVDLAKDPTYPRANVECARCHSQEAIFFQSKNKKGDDSMKLFFACVQCNYRWVQGQ
ncbi:hypothetical protein BJ742DRAFT_681184 [Cladochytrium replicatum]|nr:hypothetical protein BJ742DRAFT_681184 [Cladochytrium replicatum]